jgi:hypothetical protein
MKTCEELEKVKNQLDSVLEAYSILEEYVCLLVGSNCVENETITYANSIVQIAMNEDEFKD